MAKSTKPSASTAQVIDIATEKRKRTKAYLDKQPKMTVALPRNQGELGTQDVNYNGVRFVVPLGQQVEVPAPVGQLLIDKMIAEQRLATVSAEHIEKIEAQN
ncbi:MAG: hypothetical protein V3W09_04905 [Nitrososphaerales archaeon]